MEDTRIAEKRRKEMEARALEDERKKMEASRTEEARKQEVEQRRIQELEAKRIVLELEQKMIEEKDEEKKKKKEKELEAAQKKASQEMEGRKKAQSTPVCIVGEGWVWVTGKKSRHMMAIALTKARFARGHQTTFDTWNKIVNELNELIFCVERADGGKPLFRVRGITCNPRISRFERRLEIAEARGDITDEEITDFLHIQLTAILKEDFERCWIEGKGVTRLVATGVPVSKDLAGGKLAEAMEKENRGIK